MKKDWVNVTIRADKENVMLANFMGEDGVALALAARVYEMKAQTAKGWKCWDYLLQAEYLNDVVVEFVDAKRTLFLEAINL